MQYNFLANEYSRVFTLSLCGGVGGKNCKVNAMSSSCPVLSQSVVVFILWTFSFLFCIYRRKLHWIWICFWDASGFRGASPCGIEVVIFLPKKGAEKTIAFHLHPSKYFMLVQCIAFLWNFVVTVINRNFLFYFKKKFA